MLSPTNSTSQRAKEEMSKKERVGEEMVDSPKETVTSVQDNILDESTETINGKEHHKVNRHNFADKGENKRTKRKIEEE